MTIVRRASTPAFRSKSTELITIGRREQSPSLAADGKDATYVDKQSVAEELAQARRLFDRHNWPVIDVTRRSIEETAAAVINLYNARQAGAAAGDGAAGGAI